MRTHVDIRLPAGVKAAAQARHSLGPLAVVLERNAFDDVRLLVTELVTNSIRHVPTKDVGWIRLRVATSPSTVRIEVTDPGPGFEPEVAPPEPYSTHGRGLLLVNGMADRWGIERRAGTCVWAEIDTNGLPPAA